MADTTIRFLAQLWALPIHQHPSNMVMAENDQMALACLQIQSQWFKFSFGTKFFKLVQFLFCFVVYSLP